jgi:hypothetical protein
VGGFSPPPPLPKKILYFLSQILHFTHILKEIKLPVVEKVDFPQYINIWYVAQLAIMHKKLIWDPDKLYIFSDKILAGA